jgi:hypothetical protein
MDKKLRFYRPSESHTIDELATAIRQWILSLVSSRVTANISGYGIDGRIIRLYVSNYLYGYVAVFNDRIYGFVGGKAILGPFYIDHGDERKISPVAPEVELSLFQFLEEHDLLASALSSLVDGYESESKNS